jgi:hypothetical protein
VKLGCLVRAELRGLGIQTRAVADALDADRVLYVEPRPASWSQHPNLFAHHRVTHVPWWRGWLDERTVRGWLEGLDVVYTAETGYDPRLPDWCDAAGVGLVRHANPEQLAPDEVAAGGSTVWWSATPWRLERMPAGTRVVPMPVDLPPEFDPGFDEPRGPVRFVHSMGHYAEGDRAGTEVAAGAVRRLSGPARVDVFCQDRRLSAVFKASDGVDLRVRTRGVEDRWDQFRGQDVLVLPRRYGGLSLPTLEALAAGLVVVMPACQPNEVWPGPKVDVVGWRKVRMRCGRVSVADPDPGHLASIMNGLCRHPDRLAKWKAESRAWAQANTWEALRPLWLDELGRACRSLCPAPPAAAPIGTVPGSG